MDNKLADKLFFQKRQYYPQRLNALVKEGKAEGIKEGKVLTYLELGFSYKEISEEEIKKIEEKY